jgi:hypothetical protein
MYFYQRALNWKFFIVFFQMSFLLPVQSISIPVLHFDMTMEACQRSMKAVQHGVHGSVVDGFQNEGSLGQSMNLIPNINTTSCVLGMGVMPKPTQNIMSSSSFLYGSQSIKELIAAFQHQQGNGGLSITIWIKHATQEFVNISNTTNIHPILSIGIPRNQSNKRDDRISSSSTICDQSNIDLQLSVIGNRQLEIIYRTSDNFFSPCQQVAMDLSQGASPTGLAHIALSLTNHLQEIYYNGKLLIQRREPFDGKLRHWDSSSEIHFFSYPESSGNDTRAISPWTGQILQFSLYSNVFGLDQVKSKMTEGLPPTEAHAIPNTVHIMEDSRQGNGDLQSVVLPFSYLDREVDELLTIFGIPHKPSARIQLYITRFPSRGHLISIETNHTLGPSNEFPVLVGDDVHELIFLPVQNEYSNPRDVPYSSFECCFSKSLNPLFSSSQCASAKISIVVNSVNDPPVAVTPLPYTVHEGIQEENFAIKLTGFDVDKDDSITAVQITKLPALGYLYLSVGSFRSEDDLLHGTPLMNTNITVAGKEIYVEYRFTSYDKSIIQGTSIVDFFQYRVQDTHGAWSEVAEVIVHIVSNVFSLSHVPDTWEIPSQHPVVSRLFPWIDDSRMNRTLGLFFTTVPKKGRLLDQASVDATPSSIVALSSESSGANLTFLPSPEACSSKDHLLTRDSFSFHVVSMGVNQQIMSMSEATTILLKIHCSIEPLQLETDTNEISIAAFVQNMDDTCHGYVYNFTEEAKQSCYKVVAVPLFRVHNILRQPERVLVSLSSKKGFVTLDQNLTDNYFPLIDQVVMRSNIRFLSSPENLEVILSSVHFQSEAEGKDELKLVLEYGKCGHKEEYLLHHNFSESGPECFKTELLIPVDIQANQNNSEELLYRDFPWIPIPFTLCMLLFIKLRGKARELLIMDDDVTCDLTSKSSHEVMWKQYYDPCSGFYYYQNVEDGEITWEPPLHEGFLPWTREEDN